MKILKAVKKVIRNLTQLKSGIANFFTERFPEDKPEPNWYSPETITWYPQSQNSYDWLSFPLSDRDAQAHFMAVGTTGSGKTITMRLLMQSVLGAVGKGNGVRAIVYDPKQDMMPLVSALANPQNIFTLNPFDNRGIAWDISQDINEPRLALDLAYLFVPKSNEQNPFFTDASRAIIYQIILSLIHSGHPWTLADVIRAASTPQLTRQVLKRGPRVHLAVKSFFANKRLCHDIFATLSTKLLDLSPMVGCWEAAKTKIGIRQFFEGEYILILGHSEESKKSIEAINRLFFKRLTAIQLSQPELTTDRTWYFLDELSEAGKLHGLVSLMKRGRTKGARVAIAFQTISGLKEPTLYGPCKTDEILGQIGNRFFGRIECPETAEFASKVFGDKEYIQKSQSFTTGKESSSTDSYQNVTSRAILPSEFMSLPLCSRDNGLTGAVSLANYGCCLHHLSGYELFSERLIAPDNSVPAFEPRSTEHQYLKPWSRKRRLLFAVHDADETKDRNKKRKSRKTQPIQGQSLEDLLD